jgi:hypothetical protein
MLEAMGLELANVHAGTAGAAGAIERDLKRRKGDWLLTAAQTMAAAITREHAEWNAHAPGERKSPKAKA